MSSNPRYARPLLELAIVAMLGGCTESSLHIPGAPIGCTPLGGEVDGTVYDPAGASLVFGAVQATLAGEHVTLSDGNLALVFGIARPPREITLVFPGRPVFATTGKVAIDEDIACLAGRFDVVFQYHGQISGWFAVP